MEFRINDNSSVLHTQRLHDVAVGHGFSAKGVKQVEKESDSSCVVGDVLSPAVQFVFVDQTTKTRKDRIPNEKEKDLRQTEIQSMYGWILQWIDEPWSRCWGKRKDPIKREACDCIVTAAVLLVISCWCLSHRAV